MFDFCSICMLKKGYLVQASIERRRFLEAIVSPLMNLDNLKQCRLLLCQNCIRLLTMMQKFQRTVFKGLTNLIALQKHQEQMARHNLPEVINGHGQCDLLLPVANEETVSSSDVHFARPVFRRIAAKPKPEDILYCTENMINVLPTLGLPDAKVAILPDNVLNTLVPPDKKNGRRMPATKRKIAILIQKKQSTLAQPETSKLCPPALSLVSESERDKHSDDHSSSRPETMSCESDFDNPDTAAGFEQVVATSSVNDHWYAETVFDNPDTVPLERTVAASRMNGHKHADFDNPDPAPVCNNTADMPPPPLVPIKITRHVRPTINSIKLSEVTKAKGIGQLRKAFFALEVRSKLEPESSKPALESAHALDSTHVLESFSTHELGKKSTNSKHDEKLQSTHELESKSTPLPYSFLTHELSKKSTHVLDSNVKHLLNSKSTHVLDSKSTHVLDSFVTHELSKKSTHMLASDLKHELNLNSPHELDSKSTHVLDSFLTHELSKKSTHVLDLYSKHELNSKFTPELDLKSTHVLYSFSTHELGKISTHVPNSKLDSFLRHELSKESTNVLASDLKHELNSNSPHEPDSKSTPDIDSMSTQDIDSLSTHDIDSESTQDIDSMSTHDIDSESTLSCQLDSESTLSCQSDYEDAELFPNIVFAKAFHCISEDEKNDMSEDIYNKLHVVTNPPSEWPCTWERCYLRHKDEEDCSDDSDDSESTRSNAKWASGRRSKECKLCDKTFASLYHLWVHYEREHVDICLKECCNGTQLKNHTKRRLKVRDFSCLECGVEIRSSFQLKGHLATQRHRLKSQWRFQCDICKKKFKDKKAIAEHIEREHVAKFATRCPMCSVAFRSARALHRHVLAHEARDAVVAHRRRTLAPAEDSTLTNDSIQKRPRKQDLSNRELTQDPGNARGNSRTQNAGNARGNSRTQNRGNARGASRTQNRGNARGNSRTQYRGNARGNARTQNRGSARGNSRTQNRGSARGNSRTQNRGSARGNSRTQNRGSARGNSRTQNRGSARGNSRTQNAGNARSVRKRKATRKALGDEEYEDGRTDERAAGMMAYLKGKTWDEAAGVLDFLKRQI